jgi:hypothetical protein
MQSLHPFPPKTYADITQPDIYSLFLKIMWNTAIGNDIQFKEQNSVNLISAD